MSISICCFSGNTLYNSIPARSVIVPKQPRRLHSDTIFGLAIYTRERLLEVLNLHTCLDIRVVGVCYFASDVSADLATEAIHSFKLTGKLIASPMVCEALQYKKA